MSLAATINRSRENKEAWKYTNLAPLAAEKFVPAQPKATVKISTPLPSVMKEAGERHQIVFVNGIWQPKLSKLGELEGLMKGDAESGYRFTLAGQTCLVTAPVELVFVAEPNGAPLEINLRLKIELGASGRLTLIEHHIAPKDDQPVAGVYDTDIELGSQAKLVHGKIVDVGSHMSTLAETQVSVGEGAYYDNFKLVTSGRLVRDDIEVCLAGKLAQCALNGIMLARGATHADTTTYIKHEAPFGSSRQTYKSVVTDKARSVFQGCIMVAEGAQKTDAQQISRALLLSDQAEADAKPELKIYADDVKCSHGSTVGALDNDALFYLRARGLSEAEAKALLIGGFIDEILDQIHMPEWRAYCHEKAEYWCNHE